MCLTVKRTEITPINDFISKLTGKLTVFKILKKKNGKLCAPFFEAFKYKVGVNKSSRKCKDITTSEFDYGIEKGIHVSLTEAEANRVLNAMRARHSCRAQLVIVRMTADLSHLIKVGKFMWPYWSDTIGIEGAVFMQLNLSKTEYDRVCGKAKHKVNGKLKAKR